MQNTIKATLLSGALVVGGLSMSFANPPGRMAPPPGYTAAEMTWEDQFNEGTLNLNNWNPWMGQDGVDGRWDAGLPAPYSANGLTVNYDDPYPFGYSKQANGSHLYISPNGGGLTLVASPSNYFSGRNNPNGGYRFTWASAAVSAQGRRR